MMATMNISLPDEMRDLIRKDKQRAKSIEVLQDAITKGLKSGEPQEFSKEAVARCMQNKS